MGNKENMLWGNIGGHEQVLKADLDVSTNGIVITDFRAPDNPIIYCNKAFEELTGYSCAEVVGKNCRFLQAGDPMQTGRFKLKQAIQDEKECHVEIFNYRKDGSVFLNELYIAPVKDSSTKTMYYLGIQNDISERKLKGIDLKFELGHRRKLEQLKNEFLSAASHELKTPLTTLKASLQLLSRLVDKDLTDFKQQILLNKANSNLSKLSAVVEDLFQVTQLESNKILQNYSSFSLIEMIQKVVKNLGFDTTHVVSVTGDSQLQVSADYDRIGQVVINLLNNAVKYAPNQKNISVHVSQQPEHSVKASITDFGMGISGEVLPHIFERYYRAEPSNAQVSGLGLGLYTSREIIKGHHGDIGVDSKVGKGSTFWFTLPGSHSA